MRSMQIAYQIDGLMQGGNNSIANALALNHQNCIWKITIDDKTE